MYNKVQDNKPVKLDFAMEVSTTALVEYMVLLDLHRISERLIAGNKLTELEIFFFKYNTRTYLSLKEDNEDEASWLNDVILIMEENRVKT